MTVAALMPALLGAILGGGIFLVLSSFLWPAGQKLRSGRSSRRWASLTEKLTLAGLGTVSPGGFIVASAIAALAVGAVILAFIPVLALGVAAAVATACIPSVIISWRARARRRSHRALWPDVVDHLVSAVRSGLSLPDGVAALSRVGPAFTRAAFAEFEADYRATANFSRCLDRLKARLADPVADRILETLRMSREVGGTDLTTVLRNLSAYLRQEGAIRAEVEARQSWVVNAARLGAIAPWIVLLLLAARPEAAMAYNSPEGAVLIAGGFAITLVAYRVMIAIGRLPEEQRWFQ